MTTKAQLKREETERARPIIDLAITAAMHIIHDSVFNECEIWPKEGVQVGISREIKGKDAIRIGASLPGPQGFLRINFYNRRSGKANMQMKAIILIMDDAIYNNVLFTYDYQGGMWYDKIYIGMVNYKFTINKH